MQVGGSAQSRPGVRKRLSAHLVAFAELVSLFWPDWSCSGGLVESLGCRLAERLILRSLDDAVGSG